VDDREFPEMIAVAVKSSALAAELRFICPREVLLFRHNRRYLGVHVFIRSKGEEVFRSERMTMYLSPDDMRRATGLSADHSAELQVARCARSWGVDGRWVGFHWSGYPSRPVQVCLLYKDSWDG
jgi:hypothetical protein